MAVALIIIHAAFLAVMAIVTLAFVISSIGERQWRAAVIGSLGSTGLYYFFDQVMQRTGLKWLSHVSLGAQRQAEL